MDESFLRAIRADPEADLPRLVWADWLEERDGPGDAARAEFVRVQCELKRLPDGDPGYNALEDREHALLAEHERDWLGDSVTYVSEAGEWAFRRGLVGEVDFDPAHPPSPEWFARHAVTGVTLSPHSAMPTPDEFLRLANTESVREIDCTRASAEWTLASLRDLFHEWDAPPIHTLQLAGLSGLAGLGPSLRGAAVARNLRRLQVGGLAGSQAGYARVRRDGLDARSLASVLRRSPLETLVVYDANLSTLGPLLTAGFAPTLTGLDVSYNPLGPQAAREFAAAATELKLKSLDVSGTVLCGVSLLDVLLTPCCEGLTALSMNNAGSARFHFERLAETPFWHRAEELSVHRGTVPVVAFEPLATGDGPPNLRSLDLGENFLGAAGCRLLAEASWARNLTWLNLAASYLDRDAVGHLHIGHNNLELAGNEQFEVTDSAVELLAASPTLDRLRVLTLTGNAVTDAGVEALLAAPFTLSGLGLGTLDLTATSARALAASPRLSRLNWLDLSGNPRLHSGALMALAESPYLSPLCELDVSHTGASDAVRDLLRQRLGRRLAD
jgi:uncharacterized protein (TIGR02996 family)